MSPDRDRLQSLVDALPDTEVQVAISFLAELGEQEIIDAETAAKLDLARAEPGGDLLRSFSPCRGARSGAFGSRRPGTDRCGPGALRRDWARRCPHPRYRQ